MLAADEVLARLPMLAAIDALETVLRAGPFPPTPQRLHLEVDAAVGGGEPAELLAMAAVVAEAAITVVARDARTSEDERTLFASVGHAYEDLLIARAVVENA